MKISQWSQHSKVQLDQETAEILRTRICKLNNLCTTSQLLMDSKEHTQMILMVPSLLLKLEVKKTKRCARDATDDSLKDKNIKIWTGSDVSTRNVGSGSMDFALIFRTQRCSR